MSTDDFGGGPGPAHVLGRKRGMTHKRRSNSCLMSCISASCSMAVEAAMDTMSWMSCSTWRPCSTFSHMCTLSVLSALLALLTVLLSCGPHCWRCTGSWQASVARHAVQHCHCCSQRGQHCGCHPLLPEPDTHLCMNYHCYC